MNDIGALWVGVLQHYTCTYEIAGDEAQLAVWNEADYIGTLKPLCNNFSLANLNSCFPNAHATTDR